MKLNINKVVVWLIYTSIENFKQDDFDIINSYASDSFEVEICILSEDCKLWANDYELSSYSDEDSKSDVPLHEITIKSQINIEGAWLKEVLHRIGLSSSKNVTLIDFDGKSAHSIVENYISVFPKLKRLTFLRIRSEIGVETMKVLESIKNLEKLEFKACRSIDKLFEGQSYRFENLNHLILDLYVSFSSDEIEQIFNDPELVVTFQE